MRSIPGMVVMSPADDVEARRHGQGRLRVCGPGLHALWPRCRPRVPRGEGYTFQIGKGEVLQDGTDVAIIANGLMVAEAIEAGKALAEAGISARVINMATIKPLDEELVLKAAQECGKIITGGGKPLGGGVGVWGVLAPWGGYEKCPTPVRRIGVNDEFGHSGPAAALLKQFGLR